MQRYDKAVKEQQELNEQLASEGLINEVMMTGKRLKNPQRCKINKQVD